MAKLVSSLICKRENGCIHNGAAVKTHTGTLQKSGENKISLNHWRNFRLISKHLKKIMIKYMQNLISVAGQNPWIRKHLWLLYFMNIMGHFSTHCALCTVFLSQNITSDLLCGHLLKQFISGK